MLQSYGARSLGLVFLHAAETAHEIEARELVGPLTKLRTWWDIDSKLLQCAISQCETNTPLEPR